MEEQQNIVADHLHLENDNNPSYYEELLEDLQQMEINCCFPKLKDKMKTLNCEVRYIMPYVKCNCVPRHEAYQETKRRFRIEGCPQRLIEFVEHMIEQALLITPDATDFYQGTHEGDGNWGVFTDCVLDNLKYAQTMDDNKDVAKSIEESLRFVRNFVMLVEKRNFMGLDNCMATMNDICKTMVCSIFQDVAVMFRLFMAEKLDELNNAMNLRISEVQERCNRASLVAEEVYYGSILFLLKLHARDSCSCSVKSETLYGLIDSLEKDLMEVLTDLRLVKLSREEDIRNMINEMECLKRILSCRSDSDSLTNHQKFYAIATHVDVLASEAASAVYASAGKLELDDQKTHTKVTSLVAKINQTKHELRQTNKKDEMVVHCSLEDFLNDGYFRNRGIECRKTLALMYHFILELDFYQTFFRCTKKWCIDHPHLQVIRIHTEDVVRSARWDIWSLSFRENIIGKEVAGEKIKLVLSDMVQKLTLYRPEVEEICAKIRDLKPSSPSNLGEQFGLDFADIQCHMRTCEPEPYVRETMVFDLAVLIRGLHQIARNLLNRGECLNGLLTFLEDLIDREACLSYLQLVDKADKTVSLKLLLDHYNKEPKVLKIFKAFLDYTVWNVQYSAHPHHVGMLMTVNVLRRLLKDVTRPVSGGGTSSMRSHAKTVRRHLAFLNCILIDPLMEYYEQKEYDELFSDIGAGIAEAGQFFFLILVQKQMFIRVEEVVKIVDIIVEKVYLKYTKLSPSKAPTTERGSLNILLADMMKMNKCRQIQELREDLKVCNSFLEDSDISSNQDKLGMIKCLRTQILSLGCKLTNALVIIPSVPDWFFKKRISSFKEEAENILVEIKHNRLRLLADVDSPKVEAKPVKSEVIGFEDVEEQLIKQLTTGSRSRKVISIFGMPGLGKTTLAKKVYEAVAGSFHCSAWCYVSQKYQKKGLLLQILNEIEEPCEGIKGLNEEDLASRLYQCLMKKKDYLIVFDDVWDIKAWNEIKTCFPVGNDRNRILLTSRSKDVGLHVASSYDSCIGLNLLSTDNSRLLLKNKIFEARGFPEHLREIGTKIADQCGRLPLSLVLMAGVLKNTDENKEHWEKVSKNLNSLVRSQGGVSKSLELSYRHLPDHLKQCFLYCGALMSTAIGRGEIRSSKLVQLWVAERFIDETDEHRSLDLEEAAECCLMDLISRSLLIVSKKGSEGQIRSCRVHDLLRDFCIWKGNEEQFLLTRLDFSKHFPNLQPRLQICIHRLCKAKHHVWSKTLTRSLVHLECRIMCMVTNYYEIFNNILDRFLLLNVLDLERANMGDVFCESILKMTQLRYLAIFGSMNCIPSSINKLSDLETLIINGGEDGVLIPNTVFRLKKLRHLTVRPHVHFITTSLSPSDCLELRTLAIVNICRCETCKDAINRVPNLRKLKCIFHRSIGYDEFPALDYLSCLESIKASYPSLSPLFSKFSFPILPKSLKKITLSKFEFPWSEMEKIAALPHVEYLKLQSSAFSGKKWVTQYEFPSLKYLRLDSLDFEEWEASDDHFPCLEQLVVRGCKRLKEIPPEFRDVGTLSCIEIDKCGRSVGDSAIKIENEQRNYSGNKQFKAIICRIE